ncbi:mechanosensitive ion channel [Myroides marinus]|uniref:Mechanosensitive ion channel n=1 Tax=Myroides marinus TaxID=703342 RepID=A0A161S5A1_9FLAO|nr:mechanosensitive ion channel domain-containing protein [Myroides marinus]KUF38707.1 mechanosensitive ion channel protein MscS [Myroides marinus]KZE79949.1 mechanosensitive ion channel protein MscS [Myroides marinus]MDM1346980.1 mechanosensitive ion channel [Myroides marinus]MDM1350336.1 mechanosensitive ion channel [Myroides marinus]MDM1354136.1 mechanosensitive ion channel [Myroides marinus]
MDLRNLFSTVLEYELYASKSITITIGTLLFIAFTLMITNVGVRLLKKAFMRTATPDVAARLGSVFNFINYFIYLIMFFFILNVIGINISMFLTTSAALFVGLGFALQDIFRDLIAGIYILFDKTLNVGDVIDIRGEVGRVKAINLRCTVVETRNLKSIVIPNRKLIDDIMSNWTHEDPVIRAKIEVGAFIGTDVELVKSVLLSCVENHEEVLKDPKPIVFIDSFGESSIRFFLYYFIDNAFDNDRIASSIRFEIDKKFKLNNIELPVPVLKLNKVE